MTLTIKEQPNVFDDAFLDIIGNEFKFDHGKGLAEWMKNAADAYVRAEIVDAEQFIYLRFGAKTPKQPMTLACVDFIGMTSDDIDKAFKRWGDRRAAARGTGKRMLGGHGNGGKFYMRQMFKTSYFVTYKDGRLNVFGFNLRKKYGYAEGFKDKKTAVAEALAFAGLTGLDVPKPVRERWARDGVGFTVVTGEGPERFKAWTSQIREICQRLRVHPQSRRLVKYKETMVWVPPAAPQRLSTDEIAPKPEFEGPFEFDVPPTLSYGGESFTFRNRKYPKGNLTIWTSAEPFGRSGERSALNSIDILGEAGCIGSYRMNELGYLRNGAQAEFLYGEILCPILEDPDDDCVRNDREKLVENDRTRALLAWIKDRVDEVAGRIADEEKKEKKRGELRDSAALNQLLDRWKNRFMGKVFAEVLAGIAPGDGFGGGAGGEEPWTRGGGERGEKKKRGGEGEEGESGGSGDQPKRAPRFPRVLLSGYDTDPLNDGRPTPFDLDPRHPAIYQRPEDIAESIYWINTSRPLAQRVISQYGVKSTRWREYLFQRYVDIIMKEALYQLGRRDPDMTAEKVDDLWDKVQARVHDAAADDLEAFLFEEVYAVGGAQAAEAPRV
jgi:hypothetical protein